MSNNGFYKRRRGILEHLESGDISLIDLAVHDLLNLTANLVIGGKSSLPAGVCRTSARAIHAKCGSKEISEKAIQRSLKHLEDIAWTKSAPWRVRGRHGNYPVLICRASVHDLDGNEYRVDGEKTTDWRNPVYEPVSDEKSEHSLSTKTPNSVPESSMSESALSGEVPTDCSDSASASVPESSPNCPRTGNLLSTYREVRSDRGEVCKKKEARTAPQSAALPYEDAVICLPLKDGTEHPVFPEQVMDWEQLYPSVDVEQALRSMKGWLQANPRKRKTQDGIGRFITTWLRKEQDKPRASSYGPNGATNNGKPTLRSAIETTLGSHLDFEKGRFN